MSIAIRKITYKMPILHKLCWKVVDLNNETFYKKYSRNEDIDSIWKNIRQEKRKDRCFIVGNGPSLKIEDLNLLKEEECFASNKCYKIFQNTTWRPLYYVVQDRYCLTDDELNKLVCAKYIFIGSYCWRKHHIETENAICFRDVRIRDSDKLIFSEDAKKRIISSYTVTFTILQIAVYLGYKEIYLLGMDHDFPYTFDESGNIQKNENISTHFFRAERNSDNGFANVEGMTKAYICAKKYADAHDIKIYNVTRGGKLEVFARKELEDVIAGFDQ